MARGDRVEVQQRLRQPPPEQAPAHRGFGEIDDLEQRFRRAGVAGGAPQSEGPAGHLVEDEPVLRGHTANSPQVWERPSLRVPEILDERAGGRSGQRGIVEVERVEGGDVEVLPERPLAGGEVEPPRVVRRRRRVLHDREPGVHVVRHHDLPRAPPGERVFEPQRRGASVAKNSPVERSASASPHPSALAVAAAR